MQAGRGPGRARKDGVWEGGSKVRMGEGERDQGEGGREEAMMLAREEGRVEGGWVDEGTERGMDSARERWEGGSERRMD